MHRFHGWVLIINSLLPAIVVLVFVAIYLALVRPAIEDLGTIRDSFDQVDSAATELKKHYGVTSRSFEQRIGTIRMLLDPPRRLHGGVKKLSENFCGNVGRTDLWSKSAGGIQVASLNPAGGIENIAEDVGDALGKLKGRTRKATDFAKTESCRTTQVAFEKTFTVLAAVMAPLHEIDIALGDFRAIYIALNLDESFPALVRIGGRMATALTVLGYLALAIMLWFAVQYMSWARMRLRQGWELIRQ